MSIEPEVIVPRWSGLAVVAATGPSLTTDVANACRGQRVVAVKDAWTRLPWAEILYSNEAWWWRHFKGVPDFRGERWSSHDDARDPKLDVAAEFGLRLVRGRDAPGFSFDPAFIHYGMNSGFQAVNLALLMGATLIVLVGFDMHCAKGKHFFGKHPRDRLMPFTNFIEAFETAARLLPPGIEIINTVEGSALRGYPFLPLEKALGV